MSEAPLLIVSCPGRTIDLVQEEIRQAQEGGADLAEVRIDRLSDDERLKLPGLFPSPLPLVATLRSRAEGGEGPTDAEVRAVCLRSAWAQGFRYLDLEPARDLALLPEFGSSSKAAPQLILSSHVPESTPSVELRRLLERPRPPGTVLKVVLPCSFSRLWSDLVPNLFPLTTYAPCVLHTTGPTGPLLRAWAGRLGMYAAFAALPEPPGSSSPVPVEPSQIPVDRLRALLAGGARGPFFGVVGHPILHSRSPALHSLWLAAERRPGLYVALDLPTAEDLADSVAPLAEGGFRGLNVTHPWKQVALGLATRAGPAAESAGCANTLTFEPDGITAENTDVAAVRRRLEELRKSGVWDGSPAVVLGAGGAARSALAALASMGSSSIVLARRAEAAEGLAREYGGVAVGTDAVRPAQLVIHATPAGRAGEGALSVPWQRAIGPGSYVLDFVYAPADRFLVHEAGSVGARYEDGSRLLVYQAAESYAIWWGSPPSAELQDQALREVMCAA